MNEKGMILVYTGDGKGKTTAALGLCMRALGWSKKVCIIQFLKSQEFPCGEKNFCKQEEIELHSTGIGYSWKKTVEEQKASMKGAWSFAQEKLSDNSYDLVVLDEINNVLSGKRIDFSDIITEDALLSILKKRPFTMNVVLTGRGAGEKMIEYADLVTEMKMLKHPLKLGIEARKGIEF